ncbi:methyltransferase domain-containing protein [Alkalibaculum sp. M08DMB]|uniref:Methyltransferase domain-containing protein n=1 Tax=Alkalibaculum sporogenes TaxID=2655001 RepID=A0A6A7K7X2_9FIRM|nr:class I SAM-dependent methyltransferase [Alkalibaculum sporogenes]MPW25203.1 methyltransferase domain-containing protein [Alkalibaculum sporogenes]
MNIFNIIEISHNYVSKVLRIGEIAIDATAGHGNDTIFLAKLLGKEGHVYAFDIQKSAIDSTNEKLIKSELKCNVSLIKDSHENIGNYVNNNIGCAMFNLGYLPQSDQNIVTCGQTTIIAIQECINLLRIEGIISICVYTSHPGGRAEALIVEDYLEKIDKKNFKVLKYFCLNDKTSPYLVFIYRIK